MNSLFTEDREETSYQLRYLCMDYELTIDELAWLDTVRIPESVLTLEEPVWRSKPTLRKSEEPLPLEHEAASESFLVAELEGRVRLSAETRAMEEKRLSKKLKKRKPYSLRKGSHWKKKAATKKRAAKRLWDKDPLTRVRHTFRQGVDITREEWQRLIEPVWRSQAEMPRIRSTGGGRLNVYNLLLVSEGNGDGASGQTLYVGPDQAITDSMDSLYSARVLELLAKKNPPVKAGLA
jgi:hypothetical protein